MKTRIKSFISLLRLWARQRHCYSVLETNLSREYSVSLQDDILSATPRRGGEVLTVKWSELMKTFSALEQGEQVQVKGPTAFFLDRYYMAIDLKPANGGITAALRRRGANSE